MQADEFSATLQEWVVIFMRRSMHRFIHYTRQSGLSISQAGALFQLHRQGSCGVSDMGEFLGVSSAAASQMLERLVQQDLISRTEDPQDRRVKNLELTIKGRQTLHESILARQGWLNDLAQTLSEEEKQQVLPALRILIDKARQFEEPGMGVEQDIGHGLKG